MSSRLVVIAKREANKRKPYRKFQIPVKYKIRKVASKENIIDKVILLIKMITGVFRQ